MYHKFQRHVHVYEDEVGEDVSIYLFVLSLLKKITFFLRGVFRHFWEVFRTTERLT